MPETLTDKLVHTSLQDLVGLQAQAAQVELRVRSANSVNLPGARPSKVRGRGMEFEELRDYRQGDDIRAIDWRASERTGRPHVRVHRQEFERDVCLVVDQSASMFFGSQHRMKSVTAAHCAALLAWRAIADKDRVAAILFDDSSPHLIRPKRSSIGLLHILQQLADLNGALTRRSSERVAGQLGSALQLADRHCGRDNLIVVVSDFHDWRDDTHNLVKNLSLRNELRLCWVVDPLEVNLPAASAIDVSAHSGAWLVSDGNQQIDLDLNQSQLRQDYASRFERMQQTLRKVQDELHCGLTEIDTVNPIVDQLSTTAAVQHA